MATATEPTRAETLVEGDQCVVLRGVGWEGYSGVLKARGDRAMPRMVYLDGDLLLMSPSHVHEHWTERLGQFVMEVVVGLDIPCRPAGGTTLRRRKKDGGVEGDKTFYLANEPRVRGKRELSMRADPPPDLAVEAVHTHPVKEALEVYRRLRVPEVWVCEEDEFRILVLQPNRRYSVSQASRAFPFLSAKEISEWVHRPETDSETEWVKAVRRWVHDVLLPRARGAAE